eukprot:1826993-Pyramimonas_sp.AAC.1
MGEAQDHAPLALVAIDVGKRGVAEANCGAGLQVDEVALQHDGEVGGPANVGHRPVECLGARHGGDVGAPGSRADWAGDVDS